MAKQTTQLRLRISPTIPFLTPDQERCLIREVREMLIDGARLALHRRLGETITKICSDRKVAYLRKPVEQHAEWEADFQRQ